ncbi:MAG TPA: hypothetical protein VIM60_09690, partial [Edaphobacter sp.]
MSIIETFSKRQKKLQGHTRDFFTYDELPDGLRVQICHIWQQAIGVDKRDHMGYNPVYKELERCLAAEFGLFSLGNNLYGYLKPIVDYFMNSADTSQALDMIEVSFQFLVRFNKSMQWRGAWQQRISTDEAISDLNGRFLEHGIGYAFVDGHPPQLIRKDNEYLHKEVVLPSLRLIHEEGFDGANAEYRRAHEHYRMGSQKECLNECLKAFESTMKTICAKKKWPYKDSDTASS